MLSSFFYCSRRGCYFLILHKRTVNLSHPLATVCMLLLFKLAQFNIFSNKCQLCYIFAAEQNALKLIPKQKCGETDSTVENGAEKSGERVCV